MTNTNDRDNEQNVHPAIWATPERYERYLEVSRKLSGMLDEIEHDTRFDSHSNGIMSHPRFIELVNMGPTLVPFIFHQMTHHGAGWHHMMLLERITGQRPWHEQHNGDYYAILGSWLLWYVQNRDSFKADIYHGLVAD